MSAEKALFKYLEKQIPRSSNRKKRANKTPEKDLVKEIMKACKSMRFSVEVIESKAVYNPKLNRYLSGQVKKFYSDISGCTDLGHAVYIEVKAPGKMSTLSMGQKMFLENKINSYAFAICCDCPEKLKKHFNNWAKLFYNKRMEEASKYLLSILPDIKYKEEKWDNFGEG